MIRVNTFFDRFIRRAALAVLLTLTASALVAQAQTFSTPKNISNSTRASSFPRIAVDSSGNINVVWMANVVVNFSGDIFFSRSADGGATFSIPKNLSNNTAGASASVPLVAVDSSGNINVVWNDVPFLGNPAIFFSRSTDGGATFSTPRNLSNTLLFSAVEQIALDSSGNINLVWEGSEDPSGNILDIFFSRSTDGGVTFSTPKNLSHAQSACTGCGLIPQIAVDSSGNIDVVWRGGDSSGNIDTFFTRSTDGGSTFSTPKKISNSTGGGGIGSTQIAVDSSGNINVVWEQNFLDTVIADIFFSRSSDGGTTFSTPQNLSNGNLAESSSLEQIAVDSRGNINVVWQQNVISTGQVDVYFSRSSDGGATFSTKNVSNDTRSSGPQIALDLNGNINVVWQDISPGNLDIFLSRSTDGGLTFSTATNVSNNTGVSQNPQIALDFKGNINAVWADTTPSPPFFGPSNIFFAQASVPPPTPRAWLGGATVGNSLFTIGGGTANNNASFGGSEVSTVEGYDTLANTFSPRASLQNARFGLTASAVNGQIYAIGGTSGSSSVPLGLVEQYDPGLNSWSSKRPIPTPRWKLASGAVNGIIYAIGGGSTGNQCGATGTVEAYDPLTDSWSAKGSMPTPRWGAASAAINNLIYVVGGSLACPQIIVNPSTALEVYDPATDIWAAQMQMPTARWDLAAAAANGKIYAIGGWDPLSQTVLATVEEFDPTTNSWTTKSPMPMARSGLVAVTLNGKIYAFGGSDNVNVLAVLEVYDPLADTWTKISPGSPPPVTHTLTVASTNPSSGVGVVVSPSDNNSQGNGTTQFTRTYNDGNVVTLTAVTTVNGNNFSSWSGCDSTSTSTCTVTMNADRTVTANYISPPPPPLPDLTITSVRPVQVVYEVDLVLGKNTAFEVTVHVDSKDLLPSASIPIVLNLENDAWSAACSRIDSAQVCTESITKDKFRPAAPGGFDAVVYFNPNPRISPVRTGSHQIVAVVNPGCGILESNCNNNVNASTVEVKATNALNLIYIAVPACNALLPGACYGPLSEPLQTTIDNTNVFIQATYPLSESGLSWTESPTPFLGSSIFGKTGIIEDVVKIGIWNSLTDPSSNRKAVAIVPKHDQTQSYFEYHGYPDALGMTVNKGCCRTALVTEGAWTAGAHELGHLHGLQLDEEEYIVQNGVVTYPGNLANGFWVNANKPIFFSTCFMGASELHPDLVSPLVSRWVDKNHYVQLFQKRTSSSDPEVLLVTAVLHADGTLDLRSWYDIPNGQITKSMPGEYTVRMLDGTRQTLAEISVPVSFTVEVEPFGVQPIDVVPLVITIPYPTTAATVEILRGGQVLTRVSPISKTLADAIEAIPDFGLVKNADQRRTALRNEVEAIAQMLSVGANKSAYQAVFHDLRPAVQSWLLDNYVKTAPDQLEKNEVLFVIDGALERILNLGN